MQVNTNYSTQPAYETNKAQNSSHTRTGNDYLQELKARYPKANISARDISPGSLQGYAKGKSGEFNDVAISPDALDKFANDPKAAAEMEALLQEFLDLEPRARAIAESLGAKDASRGMVVDKNGDARFWMSGTVTSGSDSEGPESLIDKMLKKPGAAERKEKAEEKRKEKAEEEDRLEEKRAQRLMEREEMLERAKRTLFVASSSVDSLTDSFADKRNGGGFDVLI